MGYTTKVAGFIPHLTYQCSPQISELIGRFPPPAKVLDIGAGGRRIAPHVTTVDFVAGPDTDITANACALPTPDHSVDLVIATGFLEHVEDDLAWMAEMRRVLKPGGTLYIELPFMQVYHDDPIDSRRFTMPGLARFMQQQGFSPIRQGFHIGPTVAMLHMLAQWVALVFDGRSLAARLASNGTHAALSVLFWPFRYLDYWLLS